jgi:hypothetical protein
MQTRGLSERRSCGLPGMRASALRYGPRADCNTELRQKIVAIAQRYRRRGAAMIDLKLRQAGERVNHKRADRCTRRRGCRYVVGSARRSRSAIASR